MSILEEILAEAQPGYEQPVCGILNWFLKQFGEAAFEGAEKHEFTTRVIAALSRPELPAGIALQGMNDLASLVWWCNIKLSDEERGALASSARSIAYQASRGVQTRTEPASPEARTAHAVFVGTLIHPLHSPTRGAFPYVHALTRDPANRWVDVYYSGVFSPEIQAYAADRLGEGLAKVRFISIPENPNFLGDVLKRGACTFHFWCESAHAIHVSLAALLGPTIMFLCGDEAPVQFADVYWYNHDADYMRDLWTRQGAPAAFIKNYRPAVTAAYCGMTAARKRTRAELGWREDEVVVITAGNRLVIDMDQPFVDGVAQMVMNTPQMRWVVTGQLPDYFASAFKQVLGERFTHVSYDRDLMSLLACCDLFANPFRAGGGYTAAMSIEAGAPVLTRGDLGGVAVLVPPAHRQPDIESYFATLEALIADGTLREAWRAEQRAVVGRQFDQDVFAGELKAMVDVANERFAARLPASVEDIFAQRPSKLSRLKTAGRSARLR